MTQKEKEILIDDGYENDEEDEDTQKDKYLTFKVGKEDYGIDIQYVREIIQIQKITEIPDTEDFLKGVINLRGIVIPVVDVRIRFKQQVREYDDRTCIIVVNMNEILTGLIVDRVLEVLDIPESQIDPAPSSGSRDSSRYIRAMGKVGDQVKMIIDIDCFLRDEHLEQLKEAALSGE